MAERVNDILFINSKIISNVYNLKFFTTNIDFVDTANKFVSKDFIRDSLYLGTRGIFKLSRLLVECLRNFKNKPLVTNLKYINTDSSPLATPILNEHVSLTEINVNENNVRSELAERHFLDGALHH